MIAESAAPDTGSSEITEYRAEASRGGAVTPLTPATVPTGPFPYTIAVNPQGTSVYATTSTSEVSQYTINPIAGQLTPKSPASVAPRSGRTAGIAFTPNGASAYVVGTDISKYSIDATTGNLTPKSPATVATPPNPKQIAFSPSGKYAYLANCGGRGLAQARLHSYSGQHLTDERNGDLARATTRCLPLTSHSASLLRRAGMFLAVARPPAGYLMSALARRQKQEDGLTELFACVVALDDEFRGALLRKLRLERYVADVVQVQMATNVGLRTMDMHFTLTAPGQHAELWFEHKVDADFGPKQLDRYEEALARRRKAGDEVHFVVIHRWPLKASDIVQLDRIHAKRLRWHDLADVIHDVQSARDRRWFRSALEKDATVPLRMLAELAVHMEEEAGVSVSGPFDDDKLKALEHAYAARRVATELLDRIADRLQPGCQGEQPKGDRTEERWLQLVSKGWWNASFTGGALWLWVAPVAWFDDDSDAVPSFGVSVQMDEAEEDRLQSDRAFVKKLDSASLRLGGYWDEPLADISRSIPLATVVDRFSLSEQADELARFACRVIKDVARCVPAGGDATAIPSGQQTLQMLDPKTLSC
jgi:6-phosphogluconolactonase (cycloisomerase 2 family)